MFSRGVVFAALTATFILLYGGVCSAQQKVNDAYRVNVNRQKVEKILEELRAEGSEIIGEFDKRLYVLDQLKKYYIFLQTEGLTATLAMGTTICTPIQIGIQI